MKGELRLRGSVRVSGFDLEIDVTCQSFDEFEKTLSYVESLRIRFPPTKETEDRG